MRTVRSVEYCDAAAATSSFRTVCWTSTSRVAASRALSRMAPPALKIPMPSLYFAASVCCLNCLNSSSQPWAPRSISASACLPSGTMTIGFSSARMSCTRVAAFVDRSISVVYFLAFLMVPYSTIDLACEYACSSSLLTSRASVSFFVVTEPVCMSSPKILDALNRARPLDRSSRTDSVPTPPKQFLSDGPALHRSRAP